jgi:NADH:ubiquinone oxidoreductase subunit K
MLPDLICIGAVLLVIGVVGLWFERGVIREFRHK